MMEAIQDLVHTVKDIVGWLERRLVWCSPYHHIPDQGAIRWLSIGILPLQEEWLVLHNGPVLVGEMNGTRQLN